MADNSIFTYAEAIELILGFYMFSLGYWEDEINEYPLTKECIELGFTIKDNEYEDKYILSEKGQEFFHEYIKDISEKLLNEVKKHDYEMAYGEVVEWFRKEFQLKDDEDSKEIAEYILGNLYRYGNKVLKGISRSKGLFCRFVKC